MIIKLWSRRSECQDGSRWQIGGGEYGVEEGGSSGMWWGFMSIVKAVEIGGG